MKLKDALEIGLECGLTNVGEAIFNIQLHAANIFVYGEEQKEFNELISECKIRNINKDMLIEDVLKTF